MTWSTTQPGRDEDRIIPSVNQPIDTASPWLFHANCGRTTKPGKDHTSAGWASRLDHPTKRGSTGRSRGARSSGQLWRALRAKERLHQPGRMSAFADGAEVPSPHECGKTRYCRRAKSFDYRQGDTARRRLPVRRERARRNDRRRPSHASSDEVRRRTPPHSPIIARTTSRRCGRSRCSMR